MSMSVHMCACVWCPAMDWRPFKGVFKPHAQCCQDRLQTHYSPDQDKVLTEDKFMMVHALSSHALAYIFWQQIPQSENPRQTLSKKKTETV